MKLQPLKQWICDTCGETINKPEDGWWEFLQDKDDLIFGFRIVHHKESCMYDSQKLRRKNLSDGHSSLDHVVKPGYFGHMLQWLELSETKKMNDHFVMTEFIEIMRRLYLPYWEEARIYWERARKDGFHDGCGFSENDLIQIIKEYGE